MCDIWFRGHRSFLGMMAHMILLDLSRKSFAIACHRIKGKHCYQTVTEAIAAMMQEWHIHWKVGMATDNTTNFNKAFRVHGTQQSQASCRPKCLLKIVDDQSKVFCLHFPLPLFDCTISKSWFFAISIVRSKLGCDCVIDCKSITWSQINRTLRSIHKPASYAVLAVNNVTWYKSCYALWDNCKAEFKVGTCHGVLDMRSCSFVKFQALIVIAKHFKCDELTRAPCQSLPKIGFFDLVTSAQKSLFKDKTRPLTELSSYGSALQCRHFPRSSRITSAAINSRALFLE